MSSVRRLALPLLAIVACIAFVARIVGDEYLSGKKWLEPKVVTPGENGSPPSDAIVLFDGKDLSKWVDAGSGSSPKWKISDGVATAQGGDIRTKDSFGDYQLHVEWAEPEKVTDGSGRVLTSQGRGNSGVFLADRYEIQVLDNYKNPTYWDGACGAIYKQWPPMVNVCRKPGEWQTYDIIFEPPRFDDKGKLLKSGIATVLQNGVVVQNHSEMIGSTAWDRAPAYEPHPPRQPIHLQWHGNPVRYRNIWLREIKPQALE
jgi:Domain of Unknown Function (DUF1080)